MLFMCMARDSEYSTYVYENKDETISKAKMHSTNNALQLSNTKGIDNPCTEERGGYGGYSDYIRTHTENIITRT